MYRDSNGGKGLDLVSFEGKRVFGKAMKTFPGDRFCNPAMR